MTPQYAPVPLESKALAFRKDAVRLQRGEMVAPTMAIVYPTYSCNMRCFGCISNAENAHPANLSVGLFKQFVGDFSAMGGESIEFSGGGEPTLHPGFGELIDIMEDSGLQYGMITNGTNVDRCIRFMALPGSRYLRVSVYTVNQLEFLRAIVNDRNGTGSSCRIGGKVLLGSSDSPLLDFLVEEILATGVDFVSIKAKRHCADDPELLDAGDKEALDSRIKGLHYRYPGKVFGSVSKTHQKGRCWLSPLHTVVDALGTVWICCYYQDRQEDISIGNLRAEPFRALWYGPAHKAAMERVIIPECDFYDCRFHVYHDVLNAELANDTSHLAFI